MASPSRSWSVASSSSSARLQRVLELGDLALLLRGDDVERGELVVDVHARAAPRTRPCTWPARRRRRAAGRGCARRTPRRRSPCRGTAAIFLALVDGLDDHQPAGGLAVRRGGGRAGAPATAGLARRCPLAGLGRRARRSGCHLVLLHRLRPRSLRRRAPSDAPRGLPGVPGLRVCVPAAGRTEPHARTPSLRVASVAARVPARRTTGHPCARRASVTSAVKTPVPAPVARPLGRGEPVGCRPDQLDQPAHPPGAADPQRRAAARPGPAGCPPGGRRDQRQVGLRGVRVERQQVAAALVGPAGGQRPQPQRRPVQLPFRRARP